MLRPAFENLALGSLWRRVPLDAALIRPSRPFSKLTRPSSVEGALVRPPRLGGRPQAGIGRLELRLGHVTNAKTGAELLLVRDGGGERARHRALRMQRLLGSWERNGTQAKNTVD